MKKRRTPINTVGTKEGIKCTLNIIRYYEDRLDCDSNNYCSSIKTQLEIKRYIGQLKDSLELEWKVYKLNRRTM